MNDQQSVGIEFNADKTEVTITPRETPIRLTANDLSEVIARLREIRAEMSPPVAMAVGLSMPAHSMMQGNAVWLPVVPLDRPTILHVRCEGLGWVWIALAPPEREGIANRLLGAEPAPGATNVLKH